MYKKSVTDPNTILSKIFAIPPPMINEKPIIDKPKIPSANSTAETAR